MSDPVARLSAAVDEELGFTSRSPEFHGFATFGAEVEIVNDNVQLLGVSSAGIISLEDASTEEGGPVTCEVTPLWFSL